MSEERHEFSLEAYGQRIGYQGPWEPTHAVLSELQFRHTCSIPFENLDVILGRGISIEPADLEAKLIHSKRGGYCFEQNGLMLEILRQIGFNVTPLAGRVRLDATRDLVPPQTHLFLKVTLEGLDWIFDAGVGGASLTAPIPMEVGPEFETPHDRRRIIQEDGRFFHQVWLGDRWGDVYEFTGQEMAFIDRDVANWWTSTSPKARFSNFLLCARARPDGTRIGMINDQICRREHGKIVEATTLATPEALLDALEEHFDLVFPPDTRFGSTPRPWPT